MIKYLWAVIDPAFDRPFFSNSPPPATLALKPGLRVFRFEIPDWDPTPGGVIEVSAPTEMDAKAHAMEIYNSVKNKK